MSWHHSVSLHASVGRGGVNRPDDVLAVQRLINDHLPVPLRPLAEDGRCGDMTIGAIDEVQRRYLHLLQPDGRVDPGGATFNALTGAHPAPKHHTPAATFPPEVIAAAQAGKQTWNIPASVTLAQWALESNWGRAMPSGSNNPFGIKAGPGEPYVEATTREVIHGQSVMIVARFRKFDTVNDAFYQHARLLAVGRAYAQARTLVSDPDAFADALTGVYATDPNYGAALKRLMRTYNLYQYD